MSTRSSIIIENQLPNATLTVLHTPSINDVILIDVPVEQYIIVKVSKSNTCMKRVR